MILHYQMENQQLIELFMASPFFKAWSDGGVPMEQALRQFILAPEKEKGLGCHNFDEAQSFDSLQLTAIKMCQNKQRISQYEPDIPGEV